MARDNFTKTTVDQLAARVGYRCSNPRCRQSTSGPRSISNKSINVGVAAHITAASPGGPRYDFWLEPQQRKSFENGIWLCGNCAKLIDNDEYRYTVDVLLTWKTQAEELALKEIEYRQSQSSSSVENHYFNDFHHIEHHHHYNTVDRSTTTSRKPRKRNNRTNQSRVKKVEQQIHGSVLKPIRNAFPIVVSVLGFEAFIFLGTLISEYNFALLPVSIVSLLVLNLLIYMFFSPLINYRIRKTGYYSYLNTSDQQKVIKQLKRRRWKKPQINFYMRQAVMLIFVIDKYVELLLPEYPDLMEEFRNLFR